LTTEWTDFSKGVGAMAATHGATTANDHHTLVVLGRLRRLQFQETPQLNSGLMTIEWRTFLGTFGGASLRASGSKGRSAGTPYLPVWFLTPSMRARIASRSPRYLPVSGVKASGNGMGFMFSSRV